VIVRGREGVEQERTLDQRLGLIEQAQMTEAEADLVERVRVIGRGFERGAEMMFGA